MNNLHKQNNADTFLSSDTLRLFAETEGVVMSHHKIVRSNSIAICGGAYGDEGKGRIIDMLAHSLIQSGPVVVYRDNGGANAGHTVEFESGKRVALHQLPSAVFIPHATIVLGKEMVIHPADLVEEISQASLAANDQIPATILIDELTTLSLDTHRAFEAVLKNWQTGGKGSTGRGIAPAYADILLRHPLRMRDLVPFQREKIEKHYDLYAALVSGLGGELATTLVPTLAGEPRKVGDKQTFLNRLEEEATELAPFTKDIHTWLADKWEDPTTSFLFEKAQAIGLDLRWGVYPDVTASDTTVNGIYSATEGLISPDSIERRVAVIKATYMSSVGTRKLPTEMEESLAHRIREDAHEYGATTKRPRGIAYLDIPALRYFIKVGNITELMLTHMDVSYEDVPVKICTQYEVGGQVVGYRPDQEFLNTVSPVYIELPAWNSTEIQAAKTAADIPKTAKSFLDLLQKELGVPISLITTGPQRQQAISLTRE